jgi:SnoaL-like domain
VTVPEGTEERLRSLEAKLQTQLDKQEIHDQLMRYCRGCDRGDLELLNSIFVSEGAEGERGWRNTSVTIGILKGAKTAVAEKDRVGSKTSVNTSFHFIGNVLVDVAGDKATSEAYFISYLVIDRGGVEYLRPRAGRYLNWWVRRPDGWRTIGRRVIEEWNLLSEIREHAPFYLDEPPVYGERSKKDPVYSM